MTCEPGCPHLLEAAALSAQLLESELRRDKAMEHLRAVTGKESEKLAHDMDHDDKDHSKWYRAVLRARRWLSRKISPSMADPPCIIGVRCERHDFVHGAEAEELREELSKHLVYSDHDAWIERLLDRIDARDSAAWVEVKRAIEKAETVEDEEMTS